MQEYDVIIVGAGNGGLLSAATAAKNGLKTLVLEKHNLPGGSATSFCRGRFEFEAALHEFEGWGSLFKDMFKSLDIELEMMEIEDTFRAIVPGEDGYDIAMPKGRQAFIDKMEEIVPGSRKSMNKFFDLSEEVHDAVGYLTGEDYVPNQLKMLTKYPNFLKVADYSVLELMKSIEMPEKAQKILSTYWCYLGMPMDVFGSVFYLYIIATYVGNSAYIPRMRSHEMSLAIEKAIHKNGGEIWYNTKAEKILVKDGKAYGVATKDGEIYSKSVICDIAPRNVFGYMMDKNEIPERALRLESARQLGLSAITMYFGLNRSPEELGIKDYSVFISNTADSVKDFNNMNSLDDNDYMIMNCVNIANPGCSPKGTSLMWSTQFVFPHAWNDVAPENYKKVKNQLARKAIKSYETNTGITISPYIEEISIATPVTFARYLGSPGGSIYGYQGQKWDGMLARTLSVDDENFIKGLQFCGGFGIQMDGYSSTYRTGNLAGKKTVEYLRKGNM